MGWKIAGINFDHFHMGDLLREVFDHPDAEIVGISDEDPSRMAEAASNFRIPDEVVFSDYRKCLEETEPDVVILCPASARHAEWTEKVAPYGVHILMEKPFAASVEEADRMIAVMGKSGKQLAINWPLRWYPSHVTAYRLISDGVIGEVREVHYYDGNRGPLYHGADKIEREPTGAEKAASWFYREAEGGGSLLDYLGYGTTLATWFHGGKVPSEVMCMADGGEGLEVDEHSVTVARYGCGLSKFETRWGTFSDPWVHQPQPKCGFVIKGGAGTLSSYDLEDCVRIQTGDCPEGREVAVDALEPHEAKAVPYFLHRLGEGKPVDGPLSTEVSRIGQLLVDAAVRSAKEGQVVPIPGRG